MSRTLVTGGSGFVGGLLLSRLVRQGREVRALVRRPGDRERLSTPEVELALGDLEDEEALVRAAEGCEVVYHAAGMNQLCLPDPTPLYRVNVDGTARLLRAAQRADVRARHGSSSTTSTAGCASTCRAASASATRRTASAATCWPSPRDGPASATCSTPPRSPTPRRST